jgi:hypothetical protein
MENNDKVLELRRRLQQQREEVEALKEAFLAYLPEEYLPADSQFRTWRKLYGFDNAVTGFEQAEVWLNRIEETKEKCKRKNVKPPQELFKTSYDVVKYASGVMVNLRKMDNGEDPWAEPNGDSDEGSTAQ